MVLKAAALVCPFALAACGDPRVDFVGSYSGTAVRMIGGFTNDPSEATIDVTAPKGSDRLDFSVPCGIEAAVENSTTLQFDPASCPTIHGMAHSGATADFTDTYTSGTAELSGNSLVIILGGTEIGANYSDGSPNESIPYQDSLTLQRQ